MFNLTRREQANLDPFDNLFRGFMVKPFQMEASAPQIKMDVKEDDKAYTVHAEIPGVTKDNIHVAIDKNRISIGAEIKKESEEKRGETVLRSERYFGSASRSFTLENEIDETTAKAKYVDGVLELTLPKKAA
ncbi:partial 18 kDa heat shock protein, partial [Rhodocyclaceae bacterium]